jgi:hypothetical protein
MSATISSRDLDSRDEAADLVPASLRRPDPASTLPSSAIMQRRSAAAIRQPRSPYFII